MPMPAHAMLQLDSRAAVAAAVIILVTEASLSIYVETTCLQW